MTNVRWATLATAFAIIGVATNCSSSTDASPDPSTITLISGANQTVTLNPLGPHGLTDLPQLVVVRVDSMGTPLAGRLISVSIRMSDAPGANGPYSFLTGADGQAAMQLQLSNLPGPVSVSAGYAKCVKGDPIVCERSVIIATVSVPGIVAQ
jgi:hypothetical protein